MNGTPTTDGPGRMVRLKTIRPLFANGKRMEVGEVFEVSARIAAEVLITTRAALVDPADRSLIYKRSYIG